MNRVTYWVEYTYKYKYWDSEENDWFDYEDCEARRFHCQKKRHKEIIKENK